MIMVMIMSSNIRHPESKIQHSTFNTMESEFCISSHSLQSVSTVWVLALVLALHSDQTQVTTAYIIRINTRIGISLELKLEYGTETEVRLPRARIITSYCYYNSGFGGSCE